MFTHFKFWKMSDNINGGKKNKQTQKGYFNIWREETTSRKIPTKEIIYKFCAGY